MSHSGLIAYSCVVFNKCHGMSSLSHRNLFHLVVHGKSEKILPVYLHLLEQDLKWMNKNYRKVLKDLCNVIEENLDYIEKKSQTDAKHSLSQISGGSLVSCFFSIKENSNNGRVNLLRVNEDGLARTCSTASFSLCVWLRPIEATDSAVLLPLDM